MRLLVMIVIMGALFFMVSGCYYDKESILYPSATICDSSTASTYSAKISVIMNTYCNSCHSTSSADGGIILDTYAGVKAQASNGKLMGSINHASGYAAMPKGSGKLADCVIYQVQRWVSAGALNN